jgi:hypothetical protein
MVLNKLGNNPDLHPIENISNFSQGRLKEKDNSSEPKLIKEIKFQWTTGITQDDSKKLSSSIPKRINQVVAANGEVTKHCNSV